MRKIPHGCAGRIVKPWRNIDDLNRICWRPSHSAPASQHRPRQLATLDLPGDLHRHLDGRNQARSIVMIGGSPRRSSLRRRRRRFGDVRFTLSLQELVRIKSRFWCRLDHHQSAGEMFVFLCSCQRGKELIGFGERARFG